jgi:hypothetical protein
MTLPSQRKELTHSLPEWKINFACWKEFPPNKKEQIQKQNI